MQQLKIEMELITKCSMATFKDNWAELMKTLSKHLEEEEHEENADMPG